jgi:predicted  nucleic acid-binding Zn-ribbon protein
MPSKYALMWFCCECGRSFQELAIHPGCPECGHWACQRCDYSHNTNSPPVRGLWSSSPSLVNIRPPLGNPNLAPLDPGANPYTASTPFYTSRAGINIVAARSQLSREQRIGLIDSDDDSSQWRGIFDVVTDGDFSVESKLTSRIALALVSDEELSQLVTRGFQESQETFGTHLNLCVRLFANELQHNAKLDYQRRTAAFIAEHNFTISQAIQSELGIADPPADIAFEDGKESSFPSQFFSEAFEADPAAGAVSQDELLVQSDFAAA